MLMAESAEKRMIGDLWADSSGGECLFAMPSDRDFSQIDRAMEMVH